MTSDRHLWAGAVALLLAIPVFVNEAAVVLSNAGVTFRLPSFWSAGYVVGTITGILTVLLCVTLGRLTFRSRGWWLFVAAAALVGLDYGAIVAMRYLTLPDFIYSASSALIWVNVAWIACLAVGILVTRIVRPWVGWIAFGCAALKVALHMIPQSAALGSLATLAKLLGSSAAALLVVFLLALAIQLLTGMRRVALVEQALP